jgi:hypothetical protein
MQQSSSCAEFNRKLYVVCNRFSVVKCGCDLHVCKYSSALNHFVLLLILVDAVIASTEDRSL